MANEATKKDLADLEKKLNAKIQAVIDSANKAFEAETAGMNKVIEYLNKEAVDLRAVVNQHAKVINELERKCS
jgi:uncharacterized protein YukE